MLVNKYVYTCLCICVYTYMWNIMLVDLLLSAPCTMGLHCMVVIMVLIWEAKPRVGVLLVTDTLCPLCTQCPAFEMEHSSQHLDVMDALVFLKVSLHVAFSRSLSAALAQR